MSAAIELAGVHKRYGGVHAVRDVSCAVEAGEVRAVVGENGSGKSTLIRIMAGAVVPDAGVVRTAGQELPAGDCAARRRLGIDMLGQDAEICPTFTVAENVFMGRWLTRAGQVDRRRMVRITQGALDREQLPLDARALAGALSQDLRHLVQVARIAVHKPRVVALDETTASLTPDRVKRLMELVRRLSDRGTAVLFVTHRLAEVFELCDSVTVLRDGQHVATKRIADVRPPDVVRMMVGRGLAAGWTRRAKHVGDVRLSVRELKLGAAPAPIALDVRAGEVVGLAGLVGSGRSALLESIYGLRPRSSGSVVCDGVFVAPGRPGAAIRAGIGLTPEDRVRQGLSGRQSVLDNACVLHPVRRGLLRLTDPAQGRRTLTALREQVALKAPHDGAPVWTLSGGNQQKIVLGRWLEERPCVLLLDEPTRGIDVGAKREIYDLIDRLTATGTAVLLATSELPELLALSDRTLVLREGQLVAELGGQANEHDVGMAMVGARDTKRAPADT